MSQCARQNRAMPVLSLSHPVAQDPGEVISAVNAIFSHCFVLVGGNLEWRHGNQCPEIKSAMSATKNDVTGIPTRVSKHSFSYSTIDRLVLFVMKRGMQH